MSTTFIDVKHSNDYMANRPLHIPFEPPEPNETLSKVLAKTIVNAFFYKKSKELRNYFLTIVLVPDKYVTIHMYNPDGDVLLTQADTMEM